MKYEHCHIVNDGYDTVLSIHSTAHHMYSLYYTEIPTLSTQSKDNSFLITHLLHIIYGNHYIILLFILFILQIRLQKRSL